MATLDPKFLLWAYPGRQWRLPIGADETGLQWLDGQPAPGDLAARLAAWGAQQQQSQAQQAVQAWLDGTAQEAPYLYQDIVSAVSYAGSSVDLWNRQGAAFKSWRDAVWQALFALQANVAKGTAQAPATTTALIAALPQPSIPTT